MAVDCDASTSGVIDINCSYDVGEAFQISVQATNAGSGYAGYQVKPRWTDAVLDYLPAADPATENQWPVSCLPARFDNQPGGDPSVVFGCVSFPTLVTSFYTGALVVLEMSCEAVGATALTLVPRTDDPTGTHFVDISASAIDPALTNANVTCLEATPTVTLTPTITATPTSSPTPAPLAGAMAVDCDASSASTVDTDCTYDVGETFQIAVHATDADGGYAGYQVKPRWTDAVLDYLPAADPATENQWPVTCLNARVDNQPADPSVVYSCAAFPVVLSTHLGSLTQLQMTCQSAGTTAVSLVPRLGDGQGGSHFVDQLAVAMDPLLTDAQVTCSQASTATPTATLTPTITATPTSSPTPAPLAGAMAVDCDASSASTVDTNCTYDVGETFQIAVHATDADSGYAGYQVKPRWTDAVLDYLPAASTSTENQWPSCALSARVDNQPADPSVVYSCGAFPVVLSTYLGSLTQLQMTCQSAGTTAVTLVPRLGDAQGGSHFVDQLAVVMDPLLTDAQVTCSQAPTVTPTATLTPTITPTPTNTPTPAPLVGAMAVDCDASSASTIDTDCTYDVGETFQIAVHATDADSGYAGYQVKPRWTSTILDYLPAADPATENQWPVTCLNARVDNQPADPSVVYSCAAFPVVTSTDLGSLTQLQMTCQSAGITAVTLVPRLGDGQGGSHFVDQLAVAMDPLLTDAQVTCSQAPTVTPTATPTATPTLTPLPTGKPDLVLTKSDSLDPVGSDAVYQYSLLIENLGQADAFGVIVEDELPEMQDGSLVLQVEPVDPLPPNCTFNVSLRIVRCDLGDIPVGESRSVDLTVRAPMTLAMGPQNNQVASNCAMVDPDLAIDESDEANNLDCEDTTILWNCPDFDGDNEVSLTDLAFITLHWRHEVGVDEDGDGDVADRRADLDQDGSVGLVDLALVALHWREACPAP